MLQTSCELALAARPITKNTNRKNEYMNKIHHSAVVAILAALTVTTLALAGCTGSGKTDTSRQSSNQPVQGEKTVRYTCSMHPEVVQDKPGDCPKCGMKLVEKR